MTLNGGIPTVCVCNAVDTLRGVTERASDAGQAKSLLDECFSQQDQAVFWRPTEKLIITERPIEGLDWQTEFLGLPEVDNLSPRSTSSSLFSDILADEQLIAQLLDFAGSDRRFRLMPHTSTPELWTFVGTLHRLGIRVELPESCPDQKLRDTLDTKDGLRSLVLDLDLTGTPCRIADGWTCEGPAEAAEAAARLLASGRPCIAKANRGEASVGLLAFQPGDHPEHIARTLAESTFYGNDPIVVEEYISGNDVAFPSVEYVVPENPVAEPVLTHVCAMLFDRPTQLRGNVTGPSLMTEKWYQNLVTGTHIIARELQRRGYRGHFGIDAVTRGEGDVFLLDLNARRTGSTHVHDFGEHFFGPGYARHTAVGNFDFFGLKAGTTIDAILRVLSPLVRSPRSVPVGVVPCELTGLEVGKFSCMIFAPSIAGFHDLIEQVRNRIRYG